MERSFCLRVISSSRDVFVSVSGPVNGGESSLVFVCRLLSVVGNFKKTALQARHENLRAPKILHPKQFLIRSFSWGTASSLSGFSFLSFSQGHLL